MGESANTTTSHRHQGKSRMEAFSDGVLAIAITLLVLDLAIPETPASVHNLWQAIVEEWPGYLGYLVSFTTIGAIWIGHHAITEYLETTNAGFLRLNLALLFFVCLLPFTTRLLSEYNGTSAEPVAAVVYGLTLLLCALLLSALWRYALRVKLVRRDAEPAELALLTGRLTPSLAGYGVFIVLGFFLPATAVVGYLLIALFLLFPRRSRRRGGGPRLPARPARAGSR